MANNYYVLGSKYKEGKNNWIDMLPTMLERGVVSVGWAKEHNLRKYYGKPENEIIDYLKSKQEGPSCYNTLKYFMNLRPGDLIAVKDSGSPKGKQPYLSIRAYAVVVEREGEIYSHDRKKLGHMINAYFLEEPVLIELPLGGYGHTIHRLKNKEHIGQMFKFDVGALNIVYREEDEKVPKLNTEKQVRSGSKPYVSEAAHNILQLQLYKHLCQIYGKQKVKLEKDYIDIVLDQGKKVILYEVKPYRSVNQCLRAAFGQLMQYCFNSQSMDKQLELAIVGPNQPSTDELKFIKFVQKNLSIPLKYLYFTNDKITEY